MILLPAIWLVRASQVAGRQVVQLTLAVLLVANIIEALSRAPWLGCSAVLVPQKLRGRYFGFRNSILSLTNFVGVAMLGLVVSAWPGGTLPGYSVVLLLGIMLGVISVGCQMWMTDVNPQVLKVEGFWDISAPRNRC